MSKADDGGGSTNTDKISKAAKSAWRAREYSRKTTPGRTRPARTLLADSLGSLTSASLGWSGGRNSISARVNGCDSVCQKTARAPCGWFVSRVDHALYIYVLKMAQVHNCSARKQPYPNASKEACTQCDEMFTQPYPNVIESQLMSVPYSI